MSPQIIVAIDVGMTCTGVCYAVTDQTSQFYMIQKWPGGGSASADKVPTVICYRGGRFSSWGFETRLEDFSDPGIDVAEWFKVYLDRKEYRDADNDSWPRSYDDVKRAFRDFLRQIYNCIKDELETAVLRGTQWRDANIEFIFSVPTTWTAVAVTQTFEGIIQEAGFASGGVNHKVVIGLTEAEAAAVHTLATEREAYSHGQIILVVDAGGGTTDLALLRAHKAADAKLALKALDSVHGLELGSVEVDLAFEDLAFERLKSCAHELSLSHKACEKVARKMAREAFRPFKENFGTDSSDRQAWKRIDIPGISDMISIPYAGIRSGGLMVSNDEIRAMFDKQLNRMFQLIDHQLSKMAQVAPYDRVSYMVLSGGLGSSEYVRKRLIERYVQNPATSNRYARDVHVVRSRHPQAAPVKGLLHNRLDQGPIEGPGILTERISRFSLGIICDALYNPLYHVNQELYQDPTDGKRYAKNQITWFIRKGDRVSDQLISHAFFRTLKKRSPREPWTSRIVLSHQAGEPPRSLQEDGVNRLCQMTSNLTAVDLKQFDKHKKPWYSCDSSMPTYYTAVYEIRFKMAAAAAVEAELWFKDKRYSEPSSFKIDWEEGAAVSAPREIPGAVETNYDRYRGP